MHDIEQFWQYLDMYINLQGHVGVILRGNVANFSTFSNICPNDQPQSTFIYYISILENESWLGVIIRAEIKNKYRK